jgi:hypothetical protein
MATAGVTIPYRFVKNTVADADQVDADFDALAAKISGNIVDGDVAANADLDGNKISSTPSKQVPESRLGNNAVSARVLASSVTVSSARAVTAQHLQDGCLLTPAFGNGQITSPKLKTLAHTMTVSFPAATSPTGGWYTGVFTTTGVVGGLITAVSGTAPITRNVILPLWIELTGISINASPIDQPPAAGWWPFATLYTKADNTMTYLVNVPIIGTPYTFNGTVSLVYLQNT